MRTFTEEDYKGEFNLKVMERYYINLAKDKFEGKKYKAAIALQCTERQLYNKIYQHSIKW